MLRLVVFLRILKNTTLSSSDMFKVCLEFSRTFFFFGGGVGSGWENVSQKNPQAT